MRELGLGPLWRLRSATTDMATDQAAPHTPPPLPPSAPGLPVIAESQSGRHGVAARSAQQPPVSPLSAAPQTVTPAPVDHRAASDARSARIATLDWPGLQTEVAACEACALSQARRQAVLGVGDPQADWLFVGEGPGEEEDKRGEPFVGPAGKLLDAMLKAIGLERGKNVYIANAVKCRPPGNRNPEASEVAACRPFLARQIALLQPRLIVALGRPAVQALLGHEVKIAAMRGRLHQAYDRPLIVTYHPAYLLRNLPDKAKAWEDLCFARRTMRELTAPSDS